MKFWSHPFGLATLTHLAAIMDCLGARVINDHSYCFIHLISPEETGEKYLCRLHDIISSNINTTAEESNNSFFFSFQVLVKAQTAVALNFNRTIRQFGHFVATAWFLRLKVAKTANIIVSLRQATELSFLRWDTRSYGANSVCNLPWLMTTYFARPCDLLRRKHRRIAVRWATVAVAPMFVSTNCCSRHLFK